MDEGKAYNPYFPNGGVLAMPQQLFDEGIEYQDGTPATMSQQAKDVTTVSAFAFEEIQITILFVFSFCAGPLNNGMIQGKNMRLWYGKKFIKLNFVFLAGHADTNRDLHSACCKEARVRPDQDREILPSHGERTRMEPRLGLSRTTQRCSKSEEN